MGKKIAYLFSKNDRLNFLKKYELGLYPDSSLFGLNHLLKKGIKIDILEQTRFLPRKIEKIFFLLFGYNFYLYFIISKIYDYDYIISSSALNLLFLKSLFFNLGPKWIVFNISLNNLLLSCRNNRLKRFLIIKALKSAFKIICLSNKQINLLLKFGIAREKLIFIPFGVDKQYFNPVAGCDGDYILSVGRDDGRDYRFLINAFKELKEKLVIVCSLKNINRKWKIPKNTSIFYDVDYKKMKELYTNCKFVIISSKDENIDNSGSDCSGQTAILDAMACGKAVIATYRSWIEDYFEDHNNIIVVEPENTESLRNAILLLSSDLNLRKKIAVNGRKCVENKFNSYDMAKEINKLFN